MNEADEALEILQEIENQLADLSRLIARVQRIQAHGEDDRDDNGHLKNLESLVDEALGEARDLASYVEEWSDDDE